ncbi:DNA-binding protein [Allomuricauda sp. d1]|uniref:DNA-binding protein n=1 Tax=Allomuricauda sp. d1 TaxID=3136725 RepID=UPI0031CEF538
MNNKQLLFNTALAFMVALGMTAQEQSKTYKETFIVSDDAVLEINTSHADIEFETWDKNQVEITAIVTLEGATDEEMEKYFDKSPVEIKGNSNEIEITTSSKDSWNFIADSNFDFNFDVPKMELLFEDLEFPELPELAVIPEMPELPPMPPIPFTNFDYGKYKKDGDKYLKEWKKEFDKNFDKEYQKRLEAWSEEMKERSERMKARIEERKAEREKAMEERKKALAENREALREQREALREQRNSLRRHYGRNVIISRDGDEEPSIFYFSSDGEDKRYKVKKSIKIKMPKSVKLKMNVRHGAVKLAALAKDVDANLRYSSLTGSIVEGRNTDIRASYSPVFIDKWNYGALKIDYTDDVELYEVTELDLNSVSSNIIIHKLTQGAKMNANLGVLNIKKIQDDFKTLSIDVKNGELHCKIPNSAFLVEVDETHSDVKYPNTLVLEKSTGFSNVVHSGYHVNNKSPKFIKINSRYSDVVLED